MGNADAGAGRNSESHICDSKSKTRSRGARVHQEDGTDATLRNRDSVEAGARSSLSKVVGRMYIPVEEAFAEWMKDPEFAKSYEADDGIWNLVWAFADARGKMTQEDLAKAMGTSQAAVSRLESGRGNPSFKTIERFATSFAAVGGYRSRALVLI
jgi:DNA-binding phage protein